MSSNVDSVSGLPVAATWFSVVEGRHGPGVTFITEPHVDRFIRCNIWHIRGRDADLLVDSGLGVVSLVTAMPELFAERRTIACATHYHYDHVGGLNEFDERLIHRREGDTVRSSAAIGGCLRTTTFPPAVLDSIAQAGYDLPDNGELLTAAPAAGFDPDSYSVTGTQPTRLLDDGDTIDLGDRAFEVLHLPGHSPGSIGLYERHTGVLFSGDAVYDGPLLDFGDDCDVADYLSTMERLRTLPVRIVHGGHEPSFGPRRLRELCEGYLRLRGG